MADRRMFSKKIIDTDRFLEMPMSTRLLYYDLSMRADDDGFVSSPKKITRSVGCSDDDLKLLAAKQFIIPFDSGICVMKDWKINNYIQKDRYHETNFFAEKKCLETQENGSYSLVDTGCVQTVSRMDTQVRLELELGKVSEEDKSSSCAEPTALAPAPEQDVVISLELNDGSLFGVFGSQVQKWKMLYPAVDVMQELRSMAGWLDANPQRRKTKRGVMRFVNNWLSKEQDRGGHSGPFAAERKKPGKQQTGQAPSYDMEKIKQVMYYGPPVK